MPERLTRVPLAAAEIAGLLNLRGRIVTVVDMRCRLDFEAHDRGGGRRNARRWRSASSTRANPMAC